MEVILLERVEKLGLMGDVVKVKPGFARNYLLPQKKALRATKDNVARFEQQKAQFEAANIERREEAEGIASRMEGLAVILVRQASDSDQLYGSVTTRDIAREISAAGFTVEKNQIQLDRPIKTVGMHPLRVRLHPEVSVTVTANVARTQDEAEIQARGGRPSAEAEEEEALAREEAEALFEEGVEVSLEEEPAEAPEPERAPTPEEATDD